MKIADLLVERGSIREESQEWGTFEFIDLPSPGDRLTIAKEGKTHFLTVLCVHHQPGAWTSEKDGSDLDLPHADVVAKWTGST